ncbi:hypothetical protein ATO6_22760 [Oceanicola sp. 22II-s10i]|nr:hypothetical protein ATO6_22760 [Oceanicola sp. 22II-s10i]
MNVLYWVEPCPIRNTYTEHVHPTRMIGPVLHRLAEAGKIDLRMFCNTEAAAQIRAENAVYAPHVCTPTDAESEGITRNFRRWDDDTIAQWLKLVRGDGRITAFYRAILERLHAEAPIDVILLWSENGAVRSFAAAEGIGVLHGELGPTRAPFPATFYFDTDGTNGNAAIRAQVRHRLEAGDADTDPPVAAQSWLAWCERQPGDETRTPSLLDIPLTYQPAAAGLLPDRPYVYIPLQLADDLNTLMHSGFDSPLAFLDDTMRMVSDMGYTAVIKGHPGATSRHYNLRREVEALDHAATHWPEAVILPRSAAAALSVHAMARARYTITINSSVGFESMVLGVPVIARGQAIYDGGGWLQERIALAPADARPDHGRDLDRLVAAHLDRMFVPQTVAQDTDYLLRRLRDAAQGNSAVARDIDFRPWYLTGDSPAGVRPLETPGFPAGSPALSGAAAPGLAEGQTPFRGSGPVHGEQVRIDGDTLVFSSAPETRYTMEPALFFGSLERITTRDGGQSLEGWCLDRRSVSPPAALITLVGDRVHALRHDIVSRPDVQAAHPEARNGEQAGFRIALPAEGHARLLILTADGRCGAVSQISAPAGLQCRPVRSLASGGTRMPAGGTGPGRGGRLSKLLGRT